MVKKKYYGNEDLDLVRDRIELSQIASFITSSVVEVSCKIGTLKSWSLNAQDAYDLRKDKGWKWDKVA